MSSLEVLFIAVIIGVVSVFIDEYVKKTPVTIQSNNLYNSVDMQLIYSVTRSTIEDFDYNISNKKAEYLIDAYIKDDFDPLIKDSFAFYILTLLGKHQQSSLYKRYIDYIALKVQLDSGVVLAEQALKDITMKKCFDFGHPTIYVFVLNTDCIDRFEYLALYSYFENIVDTGVLPEHWSYYNMCIFINFLCSSRFAGNFNHEKLCYVDTVFLYKSFLHYANLIKKDKANIEIYFPNYCSSRTYSSFTRMYSNYIAKLRQYERELRGIQSRTKRKRG